jgi:phospho-N-acetylmuramoyl-pentapeptide-transferase
LLYLIGEYLQEYFGPFRLLTSRLFLGGLGIVGCWGLTFWLLPKLMELLPRDRGRAHAVAAGASKGKPTGAGVIFITIFVIVQLLVTPPSFQAVAVLVLTFLAMLSGWYDDRAALPWGEYKKAVLDLLLAAVTAGVLCGLSPVDIWLPFTKTIISVPWPIFIPLATVLIWTCINSTNCTDGVDGLSGTLAALALTAVGALLYFVLGHQDIAAYVLVPHYTDGASWAIMAFSMVGILAGYLWYNAHPSLLLMGDAGSRALGFLIGVFVIKCGNPFVIFIVSGVLLINGGTGLVKVALLRFAKIAIFSNVRFPLHDHVRHNRGWSNTQVLVRFSIIQMMSTLILLILLIKVR